jgi:hypothetical protein
MRRWHVVGFSLAFVLMGTQAVEAQNLSLIRACQINRCGTATATSYCSVQRTAQCRVALAQQRVTAQIVQQFLQAAPPPIPGPTAPAALQLPAVQGGGLPSNEVYTDELKVTGNAAVGTLTVTGTSTFGGEATFQQETKFLKGATIHDHLQVGANTRMDMAATG